MGDYKKTPEQIAAEAAAKRKEQARLGKLEKGPKITTKAVSTPSAAITAIDNAYKNPIKELGNSITALEQARKDAYANDEVAQRRSRNMQMIAGLSDGLASLANMIGVGSYNASPMTLTGASPELAKKFEAARQERKADIKSIDERLDQKRRELQAMKMQYGVARASQLDKEKERADAAIIRANERRASESLAKARLAQEAEQHKDNLELKKTEIQISYNLGLKRLQQEAEKDNLKKIYPVVIGDNEVLNIPTEKINDVNIGQIFDALPQEYKDLARGKEIYTYQSDELGEKSIKVGTGQYEAPTLEAKLAAIGAAARNNIDVRNALRQLAGSNKREQSATQERVQQVQSSPSAPSWTQTSNELWQNAAYQSNPLSKYK